MLPWEGMGEDGKVAYCMASPSLTIIHSIIISFDGLFGKV